MRATANPKLARGVRRRLPTNNTMRIDLAGTTFGRWTVISGPDKNRYCSCKCQCGVEKLVQVRTLMNGESTSCGCRRREVSRMRQLKHGESCRGTPVSKEYRAWRHIQERCYTKSCADYPRYGGRGITVCERWRNSFEAFLEDMGRAPARNLTIERLNNNGNYEPGNCIWATRTQQARNTRRNRFLTLGGKRLPISEWAVLYGIRPSVILQRLKLGWSEESAITTPSRKVNHAAH